MAEIVVGVDGSPAAAVALRWAVQEARLRDLTVRAVLAWDAAGEPRAVFRAAMPANHAALGDAAAAVLHSAVLAVEVPYGVHVREQVVEGRPAASLAWAAADAEMLVVGTRGHSPLKRHIPGSVGRACVREARVPTVVALGAQTQLEPALPIVVGFDGSPTSENALRWAAAEASLRGAMLIVIHAWPVGPGGVLSMAGASLAHAGRAVLASVRTMTSREWPELSVDTRLSDEPAAHALLKAARGAQLLVVGAHGRDGFPGMILGSVSRACLLASPCSVAVIPPATSPATAGEDERASVGALGHSGNARR